MLRQAQHDIFNLIENFLKGGSEKPPLIILLGPTASGKTAISIEIAKRFGCEIISADSRQVYRYMDIGTDKIPLEKRDGIPHYLIDIADPLERFTAADFKRLAEECIRKIHSRGKLPLVIGGTGLYIRTLTQNFSIPPENFRIRKALEKELSEKGIEAMYQKLRELDSSGASEIHSRNTPYIIRALEILLSTGKPKRPSRGASPYRILQIGLRLRQEILFERIHRRVEQQVQRGLVEETKRLLAMGYSRDLPAMTSLGYREIIQYLDGKLSISEAMDLIKKNTRNFAKRQITWFKKDKDVMWVEI